MLNTLVNKLRIHNVLQSVLYKPSVVYDPLKTLANDLPIHMGMYLNPYEDTIFT